MEIVSVGEEKVRRHHDEEVQCLVRGSTPRDIGIRKECWREVIRKYMTQFEDMTLR